MPATATRLLLLRVAAKGLGLFAVGAFIFVLATGLLPEAEQAVPSSPVVVDHLLPERLMRLEWNDRRVLIVRRTGAVHARLHDLDAALADPRSLQSEQPSEARNVFRSVNADYFVALDYDPDFGCPVELVSAAQGAPVSPWIGGFRSPCSGSWFDPAGRVYLNQRTTHNLRVPPHRLEPDGIVLGE